MVVESYAEILKEAFGNEERPGLKTRKFRCLFRILPLVCTPTSRRAF